MSATAKIAVHLSLHFTFLVAGDFVFCLFRLLQTHICTGISVRVREQPSNPMVAAEGPTSYETTPRRCWMPRSPPSWASDLAADHRGPCSLSGIPLAKILDDTRWLWNANSQRGKRRPSIAFIVCFPAGCPLPGPSWRHARGGDAFNGVSPEPRRTPGALARNQPSVREPPAAHTLLTRSSPPRIPRMAPSQGPIALPSPWTRTHTDAIIIRGSGYTGTW